MDYFLSGFKPFSHESVQSLKTIVLAQIIWEGYYFYQNNYFSGSLDIFGNMDHG